MIESPCIRHCCLGVDDVCLGCFRSLEEIRLWHEIDDALRQKVLLRCVARRAQRGSGEEMPEGIDPDRPLLSTK